MTEAKLDSFLKGWFIGGFSPSLVDTHDFEVAVKRYKAGDHEERHYHKMAQEVTVFVSGKARMAGKEYGAGDIVLIEAGESTDFTALTDCVCTVVKMPSVKGDKYITEQDTGCMGGVC